MLKKVWEREGQGVGADELGGSRDVCCAWQLGVWSSLVNHLVQCLDRVLTQSKFIAG